MTPDATRDPFLELWLGRPVVRVRDVRAADAAIAAAGGDGPWMIEARVAVSEVAQVAFLTQRGFRLIDTNVQLTRRAAPIESGPAACRFATAVDEPAVRAIAAHAFSQTRFHLDPRIPNETANRIKEEWAGNFFAGRRGDWMVVAEHGGNVAGFLQALRGDGDVLVIDLIAVSEAGRRRGLARSMIAHAATACFGRDVAMRVGTQIANISSLAMYRRLGFELTSASYVLHRHAEDVAP